MSFGVPVLVSDVQGNVEAIHRSGFTFESENIDDLKDQLEYLVNNREEARAAGMSGRKIIDLFFNWDKIAEKTERVYQLAKRRHVK